MGLIMLFVNGNEYFSDHSDNVAYMERYLGYADQWICMSKEWWNAHRVWQDTAPGEIDTHPSGGRVQARNTWNGSALQNVFHDLWDNFVSPVVLSAPDPMTRQMFTLTGGSGQFTIRLNDIPHDGNSLMTTQYRVSSNGGSTWGAWTDATRYIGTGPGYTHANLLDLSLITVSGQSAGTKHVQMRATNAQGDGTASGSKQVTVS